MSTSQCVEPMQEIRESTVLLRPGRQEGEISSKEEPRSVGIASPVARQVGSISPSGCVVHRSGRRMGKPLSREISFQYFATNYGAEFPAYPTTPARKSMVRARPPVEFGTVPFPASTC